MWGGSWGRVFLILPKFISSAASSCRATQLDFLPFFLRVYLGEICGCTSLNLTLRCPISLCAHFWPLYLSSSLRRNRYWMRSSCSIGKLSTPYLFHCSSMFSRSIPSLSTRSLSSRSSMPTSLGFISTSPSASCMGVFSSLIYPSIRVAQLPCSFWLLGRSVGSFGVCSQSSWDVAISFLASDYWLVLSLPFGLNQTYGLFPSWDFLCLLLALLPTLRLLVTLHFWSDREYTGEIYKDHISNPEREIHILCKNMHRDGCVGNTPRSDMPWI